MSMGTVTLSEEDRESLERIAEWDEESVAAVARAVLHVAETPSKTSKTDSSSSSFSESATS